MIVIYDSRKMIVAIISYQFSSSELAWTRI